MTEEGDTESPMLELHLQEHQGHEMNFSMDAIWFTKSYLVRQTTEASEMDKTSEKWFLLKKKGEGGQILPPIYIEGIGNIKYACTETM